MTDALAHPYLDEGRLRYHSCMCKCCFTTSAGMRQYTADFEPSAGQPFDDLWERKLTSVQQVKGKSRKLNAKLAELFINEEISNSCFCRGNAQIHCRAAADGPCAALH